MKITLKFDNADNFLNLCFRFPQKSLMNSFFVLAMRSINFEEHPDDFGNEEIEVLLRHFGEEKVDS